MNADGCVVAGRGIESSSSSVCSGSIRRETVPATGTDVFVSCIACFGTSGLAYVAVLTSHHVALHVAEHTTQLDHDRMYYNPMNQFDFAT